MARRGFRAPGEYDPRRSPKDRKRREKLAQSGSSKDSARAVRQRRGKQPVAVPQQFADPRAANPANVHGVPETVVPLPEKMPTQWVDAASTQGVTFAQLGVCGQLLKQLEAAGFTHPFPVQVATIPSALRGADVLGKARTGSGKTIAFGLAVLQRLTAPELQLENLRSDGKITAGPRPPRALVLAPTRELALQIKKVLDPFAAALRLRVVGLVGGVELAPQFAQLHRGCDVVVGTPGRVWDVWKRGALDLRRVQISVLDEADQMCEMGFLQPVQRLLRLTERRGQRLLFSATLDSAVRELAAEFVRAAEVIEVADAVRDARIEQRCYVVLREHKMAVLQELAVSASRVLLFCSTRQFADRVAAELRAAGISARPLHKDLSQRERNNNLASFAAGETRVLVATDVAARGLDIPAVDLVVQADAPADVKTYLHRIGRTGRAGMAGSAVLLLFRTQQKLGRQLFEQAGVTPVYFGDYAPGRGEVADARALLTDGHSE